MEGENEGKVGDSDGSSSCFWPIQLVFLAMLFFVPVDLYVVGSWWIHGNIKEASCFLLSSQSILMKMTTESTF